jgi:hypothetical protein
VLEVLEMEAEAREQRKISRLRRASQLPPGKTFDTLDVGVFHPVLGRKLRELARAVRPRCCSRLLPNATSATR